MIGFIDAKFSVESVLVVQDHLDFVNGILVTRKGHARRGVYGSDANSACKDLIVAESLKNIAAAGPCIGFIEVYMNASS